MDAGERYGLVAIALSQHVNFEQAWRIMDDLDLSGSPRERAQRVADEAFRLATGGRVG